MSGSSLCGVQLMNRQDAWVPLPRQAEASGIESLIRLEIDSLGREARGGRER
jgi:hypothetical protein